MLVHENGWLVPRLGAVRTRLPPSADILTGHDHIQHVNHDGPTDIVDAGTVGASDLYGIGADYVGLGDLHWAVNKPLLAAADLIQVEPVVVS